MGWLLFWGVVAPTMAQSLSVPIGGSASGQPLAPAIAGAAITQSTATFTMAATTPSVGTGLWTVQSGTATITNATSPTTTVTGVPIGTSATLRWTVTSGSCSTFDDVVLTSSGILVSVKVLLEGTYDATNLNMNDQLRQTTAGNVIPLSSATAYPSTTETAANSVFSVSGNNAIVDWVLVELRDATTPTTIVASKAALLQKDGDVVDVDGVSPVSFGVATGSYYVAIKHRNHLGFRSALTSTFVAGGSPVALNFIDGSTPIFVKSGIANAPLKSISAGVNAMWAGNANVTGNTTPTSGLLNSIILNTNDLNVGREAADNLASPNYKQEDVNLDGKVNSTDDNNVLAKNVGTFNQKREHLD